MGYCEVRLTVTYGQEVPYTDGYCPKGTGCSISKGTSVSFTNTYTVNGGVTLSKRDDADPLALKAAFNLGASYSFSESITHTTTTELNQPIDPNNCGYWTFIPYLMG
jgi:hypothetical protein